MDLRQMLAQQLRPHAPRFPPPEISEVTRGNRVPIASRSAGAAMWSSCWAAT